MTGCQLFYPVFLLSLTQCLLVTMGMEINSIPRHLSLNWEPQFFPCVSCPMLSVSFSFCLFPILLLLFTAFSSVEWLVFSVRCLFCPECQVHLYEKQVTLPSCPPESTLGYAKLIASFVPLGTGNVISEQQSLLSRKYSIRDPGDYLKLELV